MNIRLAYNLLDEIKEMAKDAMKALDSGDTEKAKIEVNEIAAKQAKVNEILNP